MSRLSKNILTFSLLCSLSFLAGTVKAQLDFVENKGQWHRNVNYRNDFSNGSFFLEKAGFTVLLHNAEEMETLSGFIHGHKPTEKPLSNFTLHSFAYKVVFSGASPLAAPVPEKVQTTYNNYFIGNDPSAWASHCRVYQAITYKNVYPNIDVRYYSDAGRLKYDIIVRPGGNVSSIAMRYDGPTELSVKNKELIIKTPVGEVKELDPYSYQPQNNTRKTINCKYVVRDNLVTFQVGNYDSRETLVIDPSVIFSSFTGSSADNWGYTATPGADGSFYAGGVVFASANSSDTYPVSPGAYQVSFGGGPFEDNLSPYDVGIFKFSPDGRDRVYATYLGGNGNEQPHSMIVDAQGNLVVAGRTNTRRFPGTTTVFGPGISGIAGNYDIFVTKFNANGTALIGSVQVGGSADDGVNIRPKYRTPKGSDRLRRNYGDDARSEVIIDGNNNIILVSCTQSNNFYEKGTSLNTPAGSAGNQDGVVLKFNANLNNILFSSYFGGSGDDACFVTSINPSNGHIYIGGATSSSNLPGDTNGTIYSTNQGGPATPGNGPIDGFVTDLLPDLSGIQKTTYIGTTGVDLVYGLKFDKKGFPYITGTTTSSNWPILNVLFSNPGSSQFIVKLKPDLSAFVYSTVFGTGSSNPNISPIAFLVDRCENVYVTGWGGGINVSDDYQTGNTFGLPERDPIPNIPAPDGRDFFFFVLQKNAQSQLFGSHFGQNGGLGDHVDGGTSRFDNNGVIYQAMCANCSGRGTFTFPTSPGAWARENGSSICNEAAVKIHMDYAGVGAGLQTIIDGVKNDTSGCVPFTVVFRDTLLLGKKFYWDFGDNSPIVVTTSFDTSHTYTVPGRYRVMLISEDIGTCNERDTAYVYIRAGNNVAKLDFNAIKDVPCTSISYKFHNTSIAVNPSFFANQVFEWDFGDGSQPVLAALNPPVPHTFPAEGDYVITLTLRDTNFCNTPLVLTRTLRVYSLVKAAFTTPPVGCVKYNAQFTFTTGSGATDFFWEFGDGTFSTDSTNANPTHLYELPGTYNVRLIVRDTSTCNKVDTSAYFSIYVSPRPTAKFDWSPNPPLQNTATQFTNLSSGATRYLWSFNDPDEGGSSTETNPTYLYNSTGTYFAQLVAYNPENCTDTFVLAVNTLILPLLDVPNAFTPGRFGENGYVSVVGFGIRKMDWRIYNRWGQMLYRTTSRKQSWDGTYKGKLQPMDVYSYTLDVEFSDGKKYRKTGDITLLR